MLYHVPGESNAGKGFPNKVAAALSSYQGEPTLEVRLSPGQNGGDDNSLLVFGKKFFEGTIKVTMAITLVDEPEENSRGFAGLAYGISDDLDVFESVYLRATNGRSKDSSRRVHTVQHFTYPNYKFDVLRDRFPGKYEAAADLGLDEWIELELSVHRKKTEIFVNGDSVLTVDRFISDRGRSGLFVDIDTIAHYRNLEIS